MLFLAKEAETIRYLLQHIKNYKGNPQKKSKITFEELESIYEEFKQNLVNITIPNLKSYLQ